MRVWHFHPHADVTATGAARAGDRSRAEGGYCGRQTHCFSSLAAAFILACRDGRALVVACKCKAGGEVAATLCASVNVRSAGAQTKTVQR